LLHIFPAATVLWHETFHNNWPARPPEAKPIGAHKLSALSLKILLTPIRALPALNDARLATKPFQAELDTTILSDTSEAAGA